jgi:hypothetical protein
MLPGIAPKGKPVETALVGDCEISPRQADARARLLGAGVGAETEWIA